MFNREDSKRSYLGSDRVVWDFQFVLETEEENSLEKTPDELKGLFEKPRDEGKEDEEILREVFESNPNADIKKLVEATGLPSLTIGRIKGQVSNRRKRDSRASGKHLEEGERDSRASEKHVEEGEVSEPDARQLVAQFGRDGLNKTCVDLEKALVKLKEQTQNKH